MEQQNIYISFISKVIIGLLLFGLGFWVGMQYGEAPATDRPSVEQEAETGSVSVRLDFGGEREIQEYEPKITAGQSVFEVLEKLELELVYQDYGEMGIFIETIEGAGQTDDNKWWQYWVNGEYATVGAGSYQLEPGDEVEFRLTGESVEF